MPPTSLGSITPGKDASRTAHHSGAHKNPRHGRHLGFSNARNVDKRWGNLSTGHVTSCGGGAPCALSYCVYRPRCVTRSDLPIPMRSTKNSAACVQTSYDPRQAKCSSASHPPGPKTPAKCLPSSQHQSLTQKMSPRAQMQMQPPFALSLPSQRHPLLPVQGFQETRSRHQAAYLHLPT